MGHPVPLRLPPPYSTPPLDVTNKQLDPLCRRLLAQELDELRPLQPVAHLARIGVVELGC